MEILENLKKILTLECLSGLRTYIAGLMMILQAVIGILGGDTSGLDILQDENLFEGLLGAGMMSLRSGMKK